MMKNTRIFAATLAAVMMTTACAAIPAAAASTQTTYLRGDVNLDGVIDSRDGAAIQRALWWCAPLNDTQKIVADINSDGHIDLTDRVLLATGRYSGEVTVSYDEAGNVIHCVDGNDLLTVTSNGWQAVVNNAANGTILGVSDYQMTMRSGNASMQVSPWNSALYYERESASTSMNANSWNANARTVYDSGESFAANLSAWGNINFTHSAMAKETAPFMRKTYQFFANTSRNSNVFTQTGYGMNETVYLVNAEVTKREGGIEFVNHVSDDTVNSFFADDHVTIDGVTLSYADGEFTVDGIPEDEIEMLHTMTVDQYDEIAIVTNTPGSRFVYGLMYDKSSSSMAALVKVRLDKNAEATVIQYSKPSDMATTINFYPQDWVVDYAMEHPDEMVTLFDTKYDADHLIFQTVHFPRMTKNTLAGALNARYQITSGFTYKQTAGNASIKSSYADTSSTLTFTAGSGAFAISNSEAGYAVGMSIGDAADTYTLGTETVTVNDANASYATASAITYSFDGNSVSFTPQAILAQHTPFMY